MNPRSLLPAVAGFVALAATSAAYRLASPDEPVPQHQPDAGYHLAADPAAEAYRVRSAARNLVAREVIAGRTTVPEAAAVFGWLDARPPRHVDPTPADTASLAGLPDPGGYTAAEMLGVRVVAFVATRDVCASRPVCMERVRAEFLAARREGSLPDYPRPPRSGACSCWRGPGPRPRRSWPAGRTPGGSRRRSDTGPRR